MPKVMYKSAEDFLQQRVAQVWDQANNTAPNYVPADGTPITLTGIKARATLDPEFQRLDPARTALYRHRENAYEDAAGYRIGSGVGNWMRSVSNNPSPYGPLGTKGPISGALAMGIPAAILGLGAGYIADKFSDSGESKWAPRAAIGAGVLGSALGAYSGYHRNKVASMSPWKLDSSIGVPDKSRILAVLNSSPGLSYQQKNVFSEGISQLSDSDARRLLQLILSAGGFGIGAIIAKFLMGAGLMGTMLGGLAGGLVGNAVAPKQPKDALGRNTLGNRDLYGRTII